jgi:hypothetical protein
MVRPFAKGTFFHKDITRRRPSSTKRPWLVFHYAIGILYAER